MEKFEAMPFERKMAYIASELVEREDREKG